MKRLTIAVYCVVSVFSACQENRIGESTNTEMNAEQAIPDAKTASLFLEPGEYVQWMQDPTNGLKKEKTIDDLVFTVQCKTLEYIVCMEERKQQLHNNAVKKRAAELSDMQYYDLKLTLKKGQSELLKYEINSSQQYNQRVNYFAFDMQNDIQLVDGNDTLPCSIFHFERTYDIAPSATFLLGFIVSKAGMEQAKTLLVYDRTFNKGLIKFTFGINRLKYIPALKTI